MDDKKSILHELYVFSEWKPEPEYMQKPDGFLPENVSGLWRWLKFFGAKKSLIDSVASYKESQQKWQIALGDQGKVIAVVTDNIIEIRTKRSDYGTIAARSTLPRDGYAQWRKLVWSPDCSFLALAYGNGVVSFFDLAATNLFNIPIDCSRPGGLECTDATHAVAEIIFMPLRVKDIKWNWEVLIITYDGKLRAFIISQTDGFKLHHSFKFNGGVGAIAYSAAHSLLYVAGVPRNSHKDPESSLYAGITAWRILNDSPFYTLSVVSHNADGQMSNDGLRMYFPMFSKNFAFIISAIISPDGTKLACIHCTGDISIWKLPSLKLQARYPIYVQPHHDTDNPLVKNVKKHPLIYYPAYVHWWSNEEIIVSRFSGAVSVCDVNDMINILGKHPEYLQGVPQVTSCQDGSFMALECESQILPGKRSRSDESMEVVKVEHAEEETFVSMSKEMVKSVLYALTDLETFQPKPKKITVVSRIYRLLGIKSTTPTDLLSRKIGAGKYKEALNLAEEYNLDKDLVYQQQWRKTHVSTDAIQRYLSKVTQKTWAVHQCVDRLPETSAAAAQLLEFGLQLTNKEIIKEINRERSTDEKISKPDDIGMKDLNAYSSEMLRCRYVMLFYKERLKLYQDIIKAEKSSYDKDEYHRLRSNKLSHSALQLAREGRIAALTCLWSYFKNVTTQLEILDKIPETINPLEYVHLLPKRMEEQRPLTPEKEFQEDDWCKNSIFSTIWSSEWSAEVVPAEQQPPNNACLAQWYEKRSREIEKNSGLISHAITLANLGQERVAGIATAAGDIVLITRCYLQSALMDLLSIRQVEGLNKRLMFNLATLDTLVYDLYVTDVSLQALDEMTTLDICKLLMTGTTLDTFVSDLKKYVIPYLESFNNNYPDLISVLELVMLYIELISIDDLSYVLKLCQSGDKFDMSTSYHLNLVERCLMCYNGFDNMDVVEELINTIYPTADDSILQNTLDERISFLVSLHHACTILNSHGAMVTMADIKAMRVDSETAILLFAKMARTLTTGASKSEKVGDLMRKWNKLLENMLSLQETVFTTVPRDIVFEIHAAALLTSGNAAVIRMSEEVLELRRREPPLPHQHCPPISRQRTETLILTAAEEYVNSASSLVDPAINFARCCLTMMEEPSRAIMDELHLIDSFPILHSYGVTLLPVQVRLYEDRLSLIDKCLKCDPYAYQSTQKLLHLGKLLQPNNVDAEKREGRILHLICEQSLAHGMQGADISTSTALRLAQLGYVPAAPVLHQVAKQCAAVLDPATRKHLLSAAATHSVGNLRELLKDRLFLESEIIDKDVSEKVASLGLDCDYESTDEEFCDAVTTPTLENVAEPPKRRNKQPLLSQLLKCRSDMFTYSDRERGATRRMVHFQEFYRSLYPNSEMTSDQYDYTCFSSTNSRTLADSLLYGCYLHIYNYKISTVMEAQALVKVADDIIYSDTPLALICYARSSNKERIYKKLIDLCNDEVTMCILIYAMLIKCSQYTLKDNAYRMPPIAAGIATAAGDIVLITRCYLQSALMDLPLLSIRQVELARSILHLNQTKVFVDLMNLSLKKLQIISTCSSAGVKVNCCTFISDEYYRVNILCAIAGCKDVTAVESALRLLRKYRTNVKDIELWARYLKANFGQCDNYEELFDNTKMIEAFKSDAEYSTRTLGKYLYEVLKGTDHNTLQIFFTLLKNINENIRFNRLTAAENVKLIKRIKAISPDIDYKALVGDSNTFIDHLVTLKVDKVGDLIKLLRTLPSDFMLMSLDDVFVQWLTSYFLNAISGSNLNSKRCTQLYRECASYFDKMSCNHLLEFIKRTCFSPEVVECIPPSSRIMMLNQAAEYCQQEYENDLKMFKNDALWDNSSKELTRWARFIENFHSTTIKAIIASVNDDSLWRLVEMSRGDIDEVMYTLCRFIMETKITPQQLATVLQCLNIDVTHQDIFAAIFKDYIIEEQNLKVLINRLMLFYKETPLNEDMVAGVMKLAVVQALPSHKQIEIMCMFGKEPTEQSKDLEEILKYSVELIRTEWKGEDFAKEITEDELRTDDARRAIFGIFLERSNTCSRRKALVDMITCWPPTSTGPQSYQCKVLHYLLTSDLDPKEVTTLVRLVMRRPALICEEVQFLEKVVTEDNKFLDILWIIILSKNNEVKERIHPFIIGHEELFNGLKLPDDMVKGLLANGVFAQVVGTPIYKDLVHYVLMHNNAELIDWAVSDLLKANYVAEAGHLKLTHLGVPESLRGFNETIQYFKYNDN